jgi:hypothetical protein
VNRTLVHSALLLLGLGCASSALAAPALPGDAPAASPAKVSFDCTTGAEADVDHTLHMVAPHADTRTDVRIAQAAPQSGQGPIASMSLATCSYSPPPAREVPIRGMY